MTEIPERAHSVPVDIEHADGTDTVYVNQRTNGGMWKPLGAYSFVGGVEYTVTIRTTGTSDFVVADAIGLLAADLGLIDWTFKVDWASADDDGAVGAVGTGSELKGYIQNGDWVGVYVLRDGSNYLWCLARWVNRTQTSDNFSSSAMVYYIRLVGTLGANVVNAYIYSDDAHQTLVDTLSISDVGIPRRYLIPMCSAESSVFQAAVATASVSNVDFGIAALGFAAGGAGGLDAGAFGLGRGGRGLSPNAGGLR